MLGEAVDCCMLLRMIREIEVSRDRFRYVFVVFLYVTKVSSESVSSVVVSLLRRCVTFCKECKLCSR